MTIVPGDWRYRLRGDPAAWLLDWDNASVYFWFQRDIVGRPEDAPALEQARERILYSPTVQALFAAQDEMGFWESPASLDLPRYRATLWSLALLAELGLPRTSRRAHLACEFVLLNQVNGDGSFAGLDGQSHAGLLARTLYYFKQTDPRLAPILERLTASAAEGNVYSLWALADTFQNKYLQAVERGADVLLNRLAEGRVPDLCAFPHFEPDLLLVLRVLTQLGFGNDPRTLAAVEMVWQRQQDGARWALDQSFDTMLVAPIEPAGVPSRWATLNALRVLTRRRGHAEVA